MALAGKKLVLFGGTGFSGTAMARTAVALSASVSSVSRRGVPPKEIEKLPWAQEVNWVRGDILKPETYEEVAKDCDGAISTVGTLIDSTFPFNDINIGKAGSYEVINRDTNVTAAKFFDKIAKERNTKLNFVFVSANAAPPLLERYVTTKREVEAEIKKCENLNGTILRPGIISDPNNPARDLAGKFADANHFVMGTAKSLASFLPIPCPDFLKQFTQSEESLTAQDLALIAVYASLTEQFSNQTLSVQQIKEAVKRI